MRNSLKERISKQRMDLHGVSPKFHSNHPRVGKTLSLDHRYFTNGFTEKVVNKRSRHSCSEDMTRSPRNKDVDNHERLERISGTRANDDLSADLELTLEDFYESGYIGSSSVFEKEQLDQPSGDENFVSDSTLRKEGKRQIEEWEFDPLNTNPAGERIAKVHQNNGTTNNEFLRGFRNGDHLTGDMLSLSISSSVCSEGSSLEGDLTAEHTRLTSVINNIDPKRLHNYLKRKLKQRDSSTIAALGVLLPKKKFKGETLHCVRCHLEYDPKHGGKTCELPHRKEDVIRISEDESGADFACERCGGVFRIDGKWKYKESLNKKYKCGACFTGVHTVSTDDVLYEANGISKTCEDYGCIVFYV